MISIRYLNSRSCAIATVSNTIFVSRIDPKLSFNPRIVESSIQIISQIYMTLLQHLFKCKQFLSLYVIILFKKKKNDLKRPS